jgi:hypothetical protein
MRIVFTITNRESQLCLGITCLQAVHNLLTFILVSEKAYKVQDTRNMFTSSFVYVRNLVRRSS